jgi:hypothetical protein
VEAYEELTRAEEEATLFMRDQPRYQETRAAAAQERRVVQAHVGFLHVALLGGPERPKVTINGVPWRGDRPEAQVIVETGQVDVVAEAGDGALVRHSATIGPGAHVTLSFDLTGRQDPSPSPPAAAAAPANPTGPLTVSSTYDDRGWLRPARWAAGLTGAAGLGAFGLFYGMASQKHGQLVACAAGTCSPGALSQIRSQGQMLQTLTNASLGVGAAGALTFGVLMLLPAQRPALPANATLGLGPRGLALAGEF